LLAGGKSAMVHLTGIRWTAWAKQNKERDFGRSLKRVQASGEPDINISPSKNSPPDGLCFCLVAGKK
jgi:hypothetical protein